MKRRTIALGIIWSVGVLFYVLLFWVMPYAMFIGLDRKYPNFFWPAEGVLHLIILISVGMAWAQDNLD